MSKQITVKELKEYLNNVPDDTIVTFLNRQLYVNGGDDEMYGDDLLISKSVETANAIFDDCNNLQIIPDEEVYIEKVEQIARDTKRPKEMSEEEFENLIKKRINLAREKFPCKNIIIFKD